MKFAGWMLVAMFLPVFAKDITAVVRSKTPIDREISGACARELPGLNVQCRLRSVDVVAIGKTRHEAVIRTDISYAQQLFDRRFKYGIVVTAWGTLDADSCRFRVTKIAISKDLLGLGKLLASEVGKTHPIQNCREFL